MLNFSACEIKIAGKFETTFTVAMKSNEMKRFDTCECQRQMLFDNSSTYGSQRSCVQGVLSSLKTIFTQTIGIKLVSKHIIKVT
jgi:hypothetical protein